MRGGKRQGNEYEFDTHIVVYMKPVLMVCAGLYLSGHQVVWWDTRQSALLHSLGTSTELCQVSCKQMGRTLVAVTPMKTRSSGFVE